MQRTLLPGTWSKSRFAFGGALLKGSHAKTKRIFNPKLPLHVVLKSSKAHGKKSLLLHSRRIALILSAQAERHHVSLHQVANAGNHIHLLLEAPSRSHLSAFLKAISGRIVQAVMSDGLGKPTSKPLGFWDARPFSRIVSRGRELRNVARYLGINSTEMAGISRSQIRQIFEEIQDLLRRGCIPRTPGLLAVGFS
ncbi:MAG: transposase [Bdellovibrionota bacterium]